MSKTITKSYFACYFEQEIIDLRKETINVEKIIAGLIMSSYYTCKVRHN